MARRKHRSNGQRGRAAAVQHQRSVFPRHVRIVPRVALIRRAPLLLYEDRRRWHPASPILRPVFASPKSAARIVLASTPASRVRSLSQRLTFADVRRVVLCKRRNERKRVIHAMGVAGTAVRAPRRNEWSEISCKR